tara:strand:+ start:433 stop:642 length:210 start_codon:yes stop_codon:yes gene_type:complete
MPRKINEFREGDIVNQIGGQEDGIVTHVSISGWYITVYWELPQIQMGIPKRETIIPANRLVLIQRSENS